MPYSLKGRNVLVTGGSRGLGAVICEKFAAEGSNVAINYASSEKAARELSESIEKSHKVKTTVLQGDVGKATDCERLVTGTISALGGIDIIISNAGWTKFSKFADLSALTDDEWDKCWAVNVKAQKNLLQAALPTFNSNSEGGVFVITSSIAGTSLGGSSMAYSVTKNAQLHLMKCLAKTQGPKVRINAVLPGLLLTEWGLTYGKDRVDEIKQTAALKTVVDLDDCADIFIMLARNTSMTGQKVQIDSGLNIANM